MCQATLTPYRCIADKETVEETASPVYADKIYLHDKNADIIELLINKIYGCREDVVISNVRLFSLLFLLDWTSAIHSDKNEPITETGRWLLGKASPYPYDYFSYLKNNGVFKDTKDEEVWQSKRRLLFRVNFAGEGERDFSLISQKAVTSVSNLVKRIGASYGVDFSKPCTLDNLENLERGVFGKIDEEIIKLVYSLDPLLQDNLTVDSDLKLLYYARMHRETFYSL